MPRVSSGETTSYSIGRVECRPSICKRQVAVGTEGDPHFHCGSKGVLAEDLHERGERLVQPDALPPLHGDEVAEPHVRDLVQ